MSFTLTTLRQAIQDYTENSETTFLNNLDNFITSSEDRIIQSVNLEEFRKNATSALTADDQFLACPDDYLSSFSLQITNGSSPDFVLQKDPNFLRTYVPSTTTTGQPKYYARYDVTNFLLSPTPNSNYTVELHYYYRPTSLTATSLTISFASGGNSYNVGETVTVTATGVSATVKTISNTSITTSVPLTGTFSSGDTFLGSVSGNNANLTSTGVTSDTTKTWLSDNAPYVLLYGSLVEAYIFMKGEQDLQAQYEKRFVEGATRLKTLAEARENRDAYTQGLPTVPNT